MSLIVIPHNEIYSLLKTVQVDQTPLERTEMAIDTYLHANPLVRWLMWQRLRMTVAFAAGGQSGAILDFGCGFGLLLPTLVQLAKTVYAIDLFPQYARRLAADRGLKVSFIDSVGSLADGSLDLILATDVLEHLDDPGKMIAQFKAKLAPGGRLIVTGPTESIFYRLGRVLAGWHKKGEYHLWNIDQLETICTDNGFTAVKTVVLPFTCLPSLFRVTLFRKEYR